MMKRHCASPRAWHSTSAATSGRPKLASHQPEEYPAFMMHTGNSLFRPRLIQESDSNEKGVIVNQVVVLVRLGTDSGNIFTKAHPANEKWIGPAESRSMDR